MKFERIYKNITGLSCPIFGIQWNAPKIEADEAKNIVLFLEDKRVLFNPANMEDADHCAQSVIEIRAELTKGLQALPSDSNLAKSLKRMRKACQEFSDKLGTQSSQNSILQFKHLCLRGNFSSYEKSVVSL